MDTLHRPNTRGHEIRVQARQSLRARAPLKTRGHYGRVVGPVMPWSRIWKRRALRSTFGVSSRSRTQRASHTTE